MLLIVGLLAGLAWIAVTVIVVALCVCAARADRAAERPAIRVSRFRRAAKRRAPASVSG